MKGCFILKDIKHRGEDNPHVFFYGGCGHPCAVFFRQVAQWTYETCKQWLASKPWRNVHWMVGELKNPNIADMCGVLHIWNSYLIHILFISYSYLIRIFYINLDSDLALDLSHVTFFVWQFSQRTSALQTQEFDAEACARDLLIKIPMKIPKWSRKSLQDMNNKWHLVIYSMISKCWRLIYGVLIFSTGLLQG